MAPLRRPARAHAGTRGAAPPVAAAGSYLSSGDRDRTLVEHGNGTTWSIASRANVPANLTAISCSNANSCVAVGGTSIQRLGTPV